MKKYIIKSILCILLIMILTSLTIYYLLSMVNISNEEYLKILLSKSYGNDFYKTVVDTIGKRFNFMDFIEINSDYNSYNLPNIYEDPVVYVFASTTTYYESEYNIKPSIKTSTYLLASFLNENGIKSVQEHIDISSYCKLNNMDENVCIDNIIKKAKDEYPSLKYFIDISINKSNKINISNYAYINIGTSNNYLEFSYNLNKLLNEKVKGISELYSEDIDYIKLYIGSSNTSMYKIRNSLELVSLILKEEIK